MDGDQLHRQLTDAAADFPVHAWPAGLRRRAARRRRTRAVLAVAAGAMAVAGVAAVVPLVTGPAPGPDDAGPAAYSASAGYVGSGWRLVSVADGATTTAIPASAGCRVDFLADGRILLDNGVNALNGRFTSSAGGFAVREVGSTFVLYDGKDPVRRTAIAALNTMAYGNADGVTAPAPAANTIVAADGGRLVVQADAYRLTFERTGAAASSRPDLPTSGGKTG